MTWLRRILSTFVRPWRERPERHAPDEKDWIRQQQQEALFRLQIIRMERDARIGTVWSDTERRKHRDDRAYPNHQPR